MPNVFRNWSTQCVRKSIRTAEQAGISPMLAAASPGGSASSRGARYGQSTSASAAAPPDPQVSGFQTGSVQDPRHSTSFPVKLEGLRRALLHPLELRDRRLSTYRHVEPGRGAQ